MHGLPARVAPPDSGPQRRTVVPLSLSARQPMPGGVVHALEGRTMGTTWSLRFVALQKFDPSIVETGVMRRLSEVVRQMSTWDTSSDLSRFNAAPSGCWVSLPAELFAVLRHALDVSCASAGAYDPTAGALVNAWGFGPTGRYDEPLFRRPDAAALDTARSVSGWQRLALDANNSSALQRGATTLDLSAIAKGFAVDHITRHLQQLGIGDCLVEIGGELRGEGIKPDGQPWWVAIERPPAQSGNHSIGGNRAEGDACKTSHGFGIAETRVALHGLSVATSGDYRRYFMADGERHSHTIDPRSGVPINHDLASVTVLHRDCMAADAWSTGLGVMGVADGLTFANEHDLAALFIERPALGAGGDSTPAHPFVEHLSEPLKAMLT